jgi:hypothetical protein
MNSVGSQDMNHVFEMVRKELESVPNLDIDALLSSADNIQYLDNLDIIQINQEKQEILEDLELSPEEYQTFSNKLEKYRHITRICDIQKGRYARWIKKNVNSDEEYNPKLSFGGVVCDIKFTDYGTYLQCFSCGKYYFSLKFDNFIFFQKFSEDEWNILTIYSYCNRK